MNEDSVLTANYAIETYALGFIVTPAAGGSPSGADIYNCSQVVNISANTDPCYSFLGWSGGTVANASAENTTVTMNATTVLTASYAIKQFTLTVTASPAAGGSPTGSGSYNCSTNASIYANTNTSGGYTFAGWTPVDGVANASAENTTVLMSQTRSLTANYNAPNTYTLTTAVVGSGTVTTNTSNPQASGSIVQLTATPNSSCWTFSGWSGDLGGSTNPTTITMDGAKSVTATFTQATYNLTTAVVGSGTVSPNTSNPHACGSIVQLTATPNSSCWTFSGWSGDLGGSTNPTTITMDGAKSVTATFTQATYNLTTAVVGSGTVSPNTSNPHACGSIVQLTATPNSSCWTFPGFSKNRR